MGKNSTQNLGQSGQGQNQHAGRVITLPYRWTEYGGVTISRVYRGRELIRPNKIYRSKSGNHGYDVYVLPPGTYTIVTITRPNNHAEARREVKTITVNY